MHSSYENNALSFLLENKFPVNEWPFNYRVPKNFWESLNNRKIFTNWLGLRLGYKAYSDWYSITRKEIYENYGNGLLLFYKNSIYYAIKECLPEHPWNAWLFDKTPNAFWSEKKNRILALNWLEHQLKIENIDDWHGITIKDFKKYGLNGMLFHYHNGSIIKAVKELYPDHSWKEWLFKKTTRNFWNKKNNRNHYMIWLGKILGFIEYQDWYEISSEDFRKNNGQSLLVDYYSGSPALAVMENFKNHPWKIELFSYGLKRQKKIYQIVKNIFKNYDIKWNHSHKNMRFEKTDRPMQLDIFIPEIKTAIEYQGEGHFFPVKIWGGEVGLALTQNRDKEKENTCKLHGINLIKVDYKWDGSENYIKSLLQVVVDI